MKAMLMLATRTRASHHPDGTFSLLRGGITEVTVPPGEPGAFRAALVARVVGAASEAGKHDFRIGPFEVKESPSGGPEPPHDEHGDAFAGERADPADLADAARKHMKCPWPKEDW